MNPKEIGQRMKERREQLNLSIIDVVKMSGLSKATIHRYENGDIKNFKLPTIETLAQILKVNPEWLIGKSDAKYGPHHQEKVDSFNKDVKAILKEFAYYVNNEPDLLYEEKPLTINERLMVYSNLNAIVEFIDKTREK